MKPDMPPPPMPSAPPSLFCNRTTPTSASAIRTWMTNNRMTMGGRCRGDVEIWALFRWSVIGWLPAATSLLRCLDPDRGRPARPYPSRACSLAGLGDRPEILGLEAGAADERAVDVAVRQDLGGVLRID